MAHKNMEGPRPISLTTPGRQSHAKTFRYHANHMNNVELLSAPRPPAFPLTESPTRFERDNFH